MPYGGPVNVAYIPSPTVNAWDIGPVAIRAYALCIIIGIIAAISIGERRWVARGGLSGTVVDVAIWAVPFGLVGARVYHVATDPELYFGSGKHPIDALKIWDGGLGIWGAILFGVFGAWIGLRRRGLKLAPFADALAPGLAVAQALGRVGNWFNNELYGRETSLPWKLQVHDIDSDTHHSVGTLPGYYHPTFLYELIWDFGVAGLVIWADRRFRLGRGRAFALYVMAYTAGRSWIEDLRIDHANHFLGIRLNDWTCMIVFAAALAYFVLRRGPREEVRQAAEAAQAGGASAAIDPAGAEEKTDASAEDLARDDDADVVAVAAGPPDDLGNAESTGEIQGRLTKENKAEPKQSHVDEPSAVGTEAAADVKSADADRAAD
jgi:prolipoprotein diacylglyceryl transferase